MPWPTLLYLSQWLWTLFMVCYGPFSCPSVAFHSPKNLICEVLPLYGLIDVVFIPFNGDPGTFSVDERWLTRLFDVFTLCCLAAYTSPVSYQCAFLSSLPMLILLVALFLLLLLNLLHTSFSLCLYELPTQNSAIVH